MEKEDAKRGRSLEGGVMYVYDKSPLYSEMKDMLDDPCAQEYFGAFMNKHLSIETLFCFIDCSD